MAKSATVYDITGGVENLASSKTIRKDNSSGKYDFLGTSRKTHLSVGLVVLPGTKGFLDLSHQGESMFKRDGDYPGIQTMEGIHGNRTWAVVILPDTTDTPTSAQFNEAKYFCFNGKKVYDKVKVHNLEAWQPVGSTSLALEEIRKKAHDLVALWQSYEYCLWNSQNFALLLAFLILCKESRDAQLSALQKVHRALWVEQLRRAQDIWAKEAAAVGATSFCLFEATVGLSAFMMPGYHLYKWFTSGGPEARERVMKNLVKEYPVLDSLII